jgi:hypothetical protein
MFHSLLQLFFETFSFRKCAETHVGLQVQRSGHVFVSDFDQNWNLAANTSETTAYHRQ